MTKIVKSIFFGFVLCVLCAARAQTVNAKSCNTSDVQTAINTATEGQTVTIPAGSCTWTTGVTISGKGITVTGAGSNRIVAYDTGTLSLQSSGSLSVPISGFSPGFSGSTFTNGLAVKVFQEGNDPAYMLGTVSSYSGSTLTVSVSSDSGSVSCNVTPCPRWLVATNQPCSSMTCITNSSGTNPLFAITEDTTDHTNVGNIQFLAGTISQNIFIISYASGGQAVLLHDMWMQGNSNNPGPPSGNATMILDNSPWRGVVWNCSFDGYPFNVSTLGAFSIQDKPNASGNVSWTTPSKWGAADTTGQSNVYSETNDYHALGYATSTDDQGRAVLRYSLYDNSGIGTHGADTSQYGQRYIDVNNNTFVFEGYNNGNTYNLQAWTFMRGGTLAFWGNTITNISSTDYGTKDTVLMTDYNLQEDTAQNQCWGAGSSSGGQYYHTPRQVGFGYVTGSGTASYTGHSSNPAYTVSGSTDSVTYVGDSEPVYMWGNNQVPVTNVGVEDYGGSSCTNPDTSSKYIVANRDYFNGSTAKPGYAAAPYPNPLELGGTGSSSTPAAPTNLQATHN
ncbi:MAG: hypothetical protein ABSG10_14580 [Terracidiphilus sp.]|jgi:hypothetical protein